MYTNDKFDRDIVPCRASNIIHRCAGATCKVKYTARFRRYLVTTIFPCQKSVHSGRLTGCMLRRRIKHQFKQSNECCISTSDAMPASIQVLKFLDSRCINRTLWIRTTQKQNGNYSPVFEVHSLHLPQSRRIWFPRTDFYFSGLIIWWFGSRRLELGWSYTEVPSLRLCQRQLTNSLVGVALSFAYEDPV